MKATPLRGEKETGWARAPPRARLTTTRPSLRGWLVVEDRTDLVRVQFQSSFADLGVTGILRAERRRKPTAKHDSVRDEPSRLDGAAGTRCERGKGARQRGAPRSSAITRPVSSGTGGVRSVQRGLNGFEAPVSCSATAFGSASRAERPRRSSAPGFRRSCPKQARPQHLDRAGGRERELATDQRGQECHAWKPSR